MAEVNEMSNWSDNESEVQEVIDCTTMFRQLTAEVPEDRIYKMAAASVRAVEAAPTWRKSAAWAVCDAAWERALRKSHDADLEPDDGSASPVSSLPAAPADEVGATEPVEVDIGQCRVPKPIADLLGLDASTSFRNDVAGHILVLGRNVLHLRAVACAAAIETTTATGKAAAWSACSSAWSVLPGLEAEWPAQVPAMGMSTSTERTSAAGSAEESCETEIGGNSEPSDVSTEDPASAPRPLPSISEKGLLPTPDQPHRRQISWFTEG